jgi:hypothetical protein
LPCERIAGEIETGIKSFNEANVDLKCILMLVGEFTEFLSSKSEVLL